MNVYNTNSITYLCIVIKQGSFLFNTPRCFTHTSLDESRSYPIDESRIRKIEVKEDLSRKKISHPGVLSLKIPQCLGLTTGSCILLKKRERNEIPKQIAEYIGSGRRTEVSGG